MGKRNEYHEQAEQFLKDCGATIDIRLLCTGKHFEDDKEPRDIYSFIIQTPRGAYSGTYGDSLHNTQRRAFAQHTTPFSMVYGGAAREAKRLGFKILPNERLDANQVAEAKKHRPHAYDILACITKYDPDTFANFCANYGYSEDSIKASKMYFAVQKEWDGVRRIFTSEQLEKLAEIN